MSTSTIRQDLFNLPNLLTMTRMLAVPLAIYLLALGTPWTCFWAAVVFGVASATDYVDGWLARKMNLVSITGKFLDPLADKIMVMACVVQLAYMGWLEAWIPILLLARELTIQGLRQIAIGEGLVISARQSGKWKTAFQLVGLIGLLVHYEYVVFFYPIQTSVNFHRVGWWLLVASLVFSIWSAVQYFRAFLRAVEAHDP